jgi:hypothetical protein
VSRFLENAENLLSAAENALSAGHTPSDMTILISPEGGIRLVADSDWPLDSLQAHRGAKAAYRISQQGERVRIDGREGSRTCRFESEPPSRAFRSLLHATPNYAALAAAAC